MRLVLMFLALALASGCERQAPDPRGRRPSLSAAESGAVIQDAEAWVARMSAEPPLNDRERAEQVTADLRATLARAKASAARSVGDRAVVELRQELDAAIAEIEPERRAIEKAAAETLAGFESDLAAFRVEAASHSLHTNGEVRRRVTSLDRARKDAAATLADLRRAEGELWGTLRRRFATQEAEWRRAYAGALARLPAIKNAPSPVVPALPPEPRGKAAQ